jgi:hypothetical protein
MNIRFDFEILRFTIVNGKPYSHPRDPVIPDGVTLGLIMETTAVSHLEYLNSRTR